MTKALYIIESYKTSEFGDRNALPAPGAHASTLHLGVKMSTYRRQHARYQQPRQLEFERKIHEVLQPGTRVLDVGSGRSPSIEPASRPPQCYYVGLDISESELNTAPPGSYDDTWVSDITNHVPELDDSFDLVVSWQVLEHVKPLEAAIENMRSYLRPGGRLVAHLSGTYSVFGLINKALPTSVGVRALEVLLQRDPETVFPAHYHHCWYSAIERAFRKWESCSIHPRYFGADYFKFLGPAERTYLLYEDWTIRHNHKNLATHYLIVATR